MSFKEFLQKAKPQTGIRTYSPGQAVTTDYKYRDIALEAYQRNPYVYAALNKVADMYADLPLALFRMDTQGNRAEVEDHEILDLLDNPNKQQGKISFMREQMIYYMLAGYNGTRKFSPDTGDNAGKPRELWNLQPDSFKAIAESSTGEIGSFEMSVTGERIDRNDIIYTLDFDPLNTEDGFSTVMSAQLAIDTFNEMMKWNLATMQNQGIPSVVISSDNEINELDARRIKQKFQDQNANWWNAREPFIASGGLTIERIGQNAQEADWKDSLKMLAEMILVSIGISPDAIIGGSTFENRKEAMKDLINNTVIPRANVFIEAYNKQLLPDYGDNLALEIDKSKIELLQESSNDKYDRVIKAVNSGLLSVGEAREELGKDNDTEHSQNFYMTTSLQPVATDLNEEDVQ